MRTTLWEQDPHRYFVVMKNQLDWYKERSLNVHLEFSMDEELSIEELGYQIIFFSSILHPSLLNRGKEEML